MTIELFLETLAHEHDLEFHEVRDGGSYYLCRYPNCTYMEHLKEDAHG